MTDENTPQPKVWTVDRLLRWTQSYFAEHQVDEPRLAAEILLATALSWKRIELYTRFDQVPEAARLDVFRDLVNRAAAGEPISYLVGLKEFFSLEFEVSPAVLIPRPETEILVQQVIDHVRGCGLEPVELLDMGTGSGCIVVTILKHVPAVRAVATDVADEALEIAARNAARHGVGERVRFVHADGLALPAQVRPAGGFEVIVSNPPYVSAAELGTLDRTVREYEPTLALTDGADGLRFFRMLAAEGAGMLRPGGAVFVEVADGQGATVRELFAAGGEFAHVGTFRDAVGPHDRVLYFRRKDG